MSDDAPRPTRHPVASRVGVLVVAVVAVNVLLHVVPLPDVGLSAPDLPDAPDLPGWADSTLKVLLKVKNGALIVLVVLAVVGAIEEGRRRERRERDEAGSTP